jgi:uncharacterized protein (TIGR03083 family)
METSRFLESLASDYGLLRDAARSGGLDAPVPSCPGWTAADLVRHVGEVYLHKVAIMRSGKFPEDWPPDFSGEEPIALLDRGYAGLTAEFAARPPSAPAVTWYKPEQDVAFWIRRMAQETAIHRIDAELAARRPVSPVPDDIAADGIDEVLIRMLAYGSAAWPDEYAKLAGACPAREHGDDTIVVRAGGSEWTVLPAQDQVRVETGAGGHVRAAVEAAPDPMLRWLWGRGADVTVSGDPDWVACLRRLLAAMTQ